MRDLDRALAEITAIRTQLARGSEFRGYGPATLAATGVLALAAACGQALWLTDPNRQIEVYFGLWVAIAALSAILIGLETVARTRRAHSRLADEMLSAAIEQFLPAAAAGALLTVVLLRFAPEGRWMLPGLWQIIYSLGVFASCRFLPRPVFAAGLWYLGAGLACLAFARGPDAFSPWAMGAPFGVGQLFIAAVVNRSAREPEMERD
jgi:hypothetical protein